MNVGEQLSESFIREYLDDLKEKYNTVDNNVGLEYHIEQTRIDYGVAVFVIIKRDTVYCKKFVFRFRKASPTLGVSGLSNTGTGLVEADNKLLRKRSVERVFPTILNKKQEK